MFEVCSVHKNAICSLQYKSYTYNIRVQIFFSYLNLFKGGLQAIAELLQVDCEMYGLTNDHYSVTLRRYAGMALTNLTFGDVANKVRAEL